MKSGWLLNRKHEAHNQVGVIGLEFAQQGLNAVQLQSDNTGVISAKTYDSVVYPDDFNPNQYIPSEYKKLLKPLLKKAKFTGKKVNTVLPAGELKIISVSYQVKKGQPEVDAIVNVISDRIEGNVQDYVVDYLPVRRTDDSDTGLAIVALAKQEKINSYLECLRKSGLQVNGLEIGPAAIKRLVSAMQLSAKRENILVINFGNNQSYLSIISGRRLLFDEEMSFGESALLQKLEDVLDLDKELVIKQIDKHGLDSSGCDGEAGANPEIAATLLQIVKPSFIKMSENIRRALMYAAAETRGDLVSKIYLMGSIARWRGVDKLLSELLNLPVEVIPNPLAAFGVEMQDSNAVGAKPELAVSTGLALRGLLDHG